MMQQDSKAQLIHEIQGLNPSASEQFLSRFSPSDLTEYLSSLRGARRSSRRYNRPVKAEAAMAIG